MAPHRRSRFASRRRVEDEGEEDGSIYGEIEDDTLSEDSVSSHPGDEGDGEASEVAEQDVPETSNGHGHGQSRSPKEARDKQSASGRKRGPPKKNLFESKVSDTEAMLNGLTLTEEGEKMEAIDFEDMKEGVDTAAASSRQGSNNKGGKRETLAERKRREHEEYTKEREENPAFVPTRGNFFLHDKRTDAPPRNSNRVKSKPNGLIVDSNAPRRSTQKPDVTDGPWRHDLHESVARETPSYPPYPNPSVVQPPRPVPTAPSSSPPNRSFSSTVVVGTVPVVVNLPGMENPITLPAVPKKQHTRLPQHRPPLRRDKPVRISLPGQHPRYIFPSVERSFIFIPRAMRPNQQYRGRGRGGFYYGTRRSSMYGGTYTPSLPMSRRSSFGRPSGIGSPAASIISRTAMAPGEGGKPVVRLPPNVQPPPTNMPQSTFVPGPPAYGPPPAQFPENKQGPPIPMHQPRPQKTVSLAGIEPPMTYPQPHPQEQPFHQQMPAQPDSQGFARPHPPQATATPLSQIPERAIHAVPFQPVVYPQPPGYYPAAGYPPGPVAYPMAPAEYPMYAAGPMPVPQGQQMYPMPAPGGEQPTESGTVAHESNGTVYYFDASQFGNNQYPNAPYGAPPGAAGTGEAMPPPAPYYYPNTYYNPYYPG